MSRRSLMLLLTTVAVAAGTLAAAPAALSAGRPAAGLGAARITARQLAGQRVIYSYPGPTVPASLLQHIRDGEAAGVIFFRENLGTPEQIATTVQQLTQAQQASVIHAPLLLMTDQEGGLVRRLPGEPVQSAKQVGQSSDPAAGGTAGAGAAATLRAAGMNVNLAPVLDVFDTPGNFIDQFQRSFSDDPAAVSRLGTDFLVAQQRAGVAATAKHFPGLGTAPRGANTDLQPVTLPLTLDQLRTREELPYRSAIRAGVDLVMLSWALYPALDATRPAGLSPTVVQRELRTRLHFRGVTITDALEAGSLASFGGTGERAALAAGAGMDLILCAARDVTQGEQAVSALADGLTGGRLSPVGFAAALARVEALRIRLGG